MFAESLLDSPWAHRWHRGWTTAASFGLQALAVGVALLLPLIDTQGLPQLPLIARLIAPTPPPSAPPPAPETRTAAPPQSNMIGIRVMAPTRIPTEVRMLTETVPPPPAVDPEAFGVNHGIGDTRSTGTVIDSIVGSNLGGPPAPPRPAAQPLRLSRMMEGNLARRVQPEYPPLARQARIQGEVVLQAVISRQGTIENLVVLRGHPMLVRAAIEAVQQWRYRPYYLNGEPVEVETQVTVNFVLSGR